MLAHPGARRHPDHRRDGEAEHHAAHRPPATAGVGQGRGDERGQPEEGPVRESGEEPGDHESAVVGGERAGGVGDPEPRHQADQQPTARQPGAQHRDQRRTEHDAEGVGRDDVSGGRDVHADASGDLGQDAHGDELGGADGKAAGGQREDRPGQAGLVTRGRRGRRRRVGSGAHGRGHVAPSQWDGSENG